MVKSIEMDEFCQALLAALIAVRKANEIPTYMAGKARDINAGHILETLKNQLEQREVLKQFILSNNKQKICSDEDFRTKGSIMDMIYEIRPYIDRIKGGGFKLMLDRYLTAHRLAIELSELVEEIVGHHETEMQKQQMK